METMYQHTEELQPISEFTKLSKEELAGLIGSLDLKMTVRDIAYCQNQYRMRERRNPTVEELRLLDQLYQHRTRRPEYYGLRSFYTSDPLLAQSYADLIAKATHLRREERPFTPAELSGVLTRTLIKAGKQISVPSLHAGDNAPLRLIAHRYLETGAAVLNETLAVVGQAWEQAPKPHTPKASDHILLICPGGLAPAAFAATVAELPLPQTAQLRTIGQSGLLEALLAWDGVYLVQSYLPGFTESDPLTKLIPAFSDSLLVCVDADAAMPLRNMAVAAGLVVSIIGKCISNANLTIRREGSTPLQLETAFLRAFSPTLPADAEIPGCCMDDIILPNAKQQTVIAGGDCALYTAAIPHTPYALQHDVLLSGACTAVTENTFRASILATAYAINRTVAAGADPETLTLCHRIHTPSMTDPNLAVGDVMAAMLGAYRVQAELSLPDINGQFIPGDGEKASLTVFSAAPKPEKVIPHTFTSAGSSVYLLTPLSTQDSPVDFDDYRKLLRYVHNLCRDGIALSVLAIDQTNFDSALSIMTGGGLGYLASEPLPHAMCGFLIETKQVIQGVLCGVTTATPTIRIGEDETPITSYRLPHIPVERIPMSPIGIHNPIICLPQTKALGSILPIKQLAATRFASIETVPLHAPSSRIQLTNFANAMLCANITVLVGTTQELDRILQNRRVDYAKNEMLSRGGLLLCLHTDQSPARNAPIPSDHPFFFGTPALFCDRAAIRFEGENNEIVHMRSTSIAIPRMIACAIAYFQ